MILNCLNFVSRLLCNKLGASELGMGRDSVSDFEESEELDENPWKSMPSGESGESSCKVLAAFCELLELGVKALTVL